MPTYQYACTECGTPLEVVQSFTDEALTECPTCGGRLRKVFSAVGVVFKGSGFYRTDSREEKKSPANGAAKGKPAAETKGDGAATKDSSSSSESGGSKAKEPAKSATSGSSGSGSSGSGSSGSSGSGSSSSGTSGSGSSGSGSSGASTSK